MKSIFKFFLVFLVALFNPLIGIALLVLIYIMGRQDAHVDRIIKAIIDPDGDSRKKKIVVKKHDSSTIASVILGVIMGGIFLAFIV